MAFLERCVRTKGVLRSLSAPERGSFLLFLPFACKDMLFWVADSVLRARCVSLALSDRHAKIACDLADRHARTACDLEDRKLQNGVLRTLCKGEGRSEIAIRTGARTF